MEPKIKIEDYNYTLPEDKIARFPLDDRDASKILIFRSNNICESKFSNLVELLPEDSFIVFNNTKVVPARLIFRKESGAKIEIFCLEPYEPSEYVKAFSSRRECSWISVVGNARRWKKDWIKFDNFNNHEAGNLNLTAFCEEKRDDKYIVKFRWEGDHSFSEIMDICGKVPIPPYLRRESEDLDKERYQTLYAKERGSVAAPTAGLHFTEHLLKSIKERGINVDEISLHVGAGTFIPVKSEHISEHKMHSEPFSITKKIIFSLLNSYLNNQPIVAVGTTSTRCVESLYYLGVQILLHGKPLTVSQWEPYYSKDKFSVEESLKALVSWMEINEKETLESRTEIIIVPGYKFKLINVLITNFHQPKSTLLLLISAFVGEKWRDIYDYALIRNFRFLSYGDSSILFR